MTAAVAIVLAGTVFSQSSDEPSEQVRIRSAPQPVFPEASRDYIYGETVKVTMHVDKAGVVKEARAYGPLARCSNLNDPIAAAVNKAALDAAKTTVFEPVLKDGKPVDATLSVAFRLRPREVLSQAPKDAKLIKGGVLNGKAISLPKPYWPVFAKENRMSGRVAIQILIDEQGQVMSAGAVAGHPEFIYASTEAACKARFSPTKLSGIPVKVSGVISYNFRP